jgi:hypothetical protein
MKAIILISEASLPLAKTLQRELPDTLIYTKNECEGCISITSCHRFIEEHFNDFDSIIFIGAMGICVRSIAGCIKNKYKDPAVVCVDSTGRFVISVLSGHVGGANELTRHIAAITGGEAVITTQSDNAGLWALDTLAGKYGWKITVPHAKMNRLVTLFVNREPTALLLDIKDKGTEYLERTLPAHVKVFYHFEDMPQSEFKLIADKIWLMDKANGVTIGTPEDLSIDGCLSNFFSRKGIVFDMETGLFRIDNEFEKEVRLVGHGNKYAMVRKALQRNGILASRRVESDFYIETGDMTTSGYIIHPVAGRTIKVDTIEELLEQVTAILASV